VSTRRFLALILGMTASLVMGCNEDKSIDETKLSPRLGEAREQLEGAKYQVESVELGEEGIPSLIIRSGEDAAVIGIYPGLNRRDGLSDLISVVPRVVEAGDGDTFPTPTLETCGVDVFVSSTARAGRLAGEVRNMSGLCRPH
jgi:hypothetical protein